MKKINHMALLLASTVLMAIMFFGELYRSYPPFLVLTIISFLLSALCLFLIHHKTLQMRLCVYNAIILIAYQIWIIYLLWSIKNNSGLTFSKFPVSVVFPVICAILNVVSATLLRKAIVAEMFSDVLQKSKKICNTKSKNLPGGKGKK